MSLKDRASLDVEATQQLVDWCREQFTTQPTAFDAEAAIARRLGAQKSGGAIDVNLGTGVGYSVLEAVAAFKRASNRDIPYEIAPRRDGVRIAKSGDELIRGEQLGARKRLQISRFHGDLGKTLGALKIGDLGAQRLDLAQFLRFFLLQFLYVLPRLTHRDFGLVTTGRRRREKQAQEKHCDADHTINSSSPALLTMSVEADQASRYRSRRRALRDE